MAAVIMYWCSSAAAKPIPANTTRVTIIRKTRAPRPDAARNAKISIASTALAMATPSAPMVSVTPVSVHQAYSATAKPITAANSSKIVPTRED